MKQFPLALLVLLSVYLATGKTIAAPANDNRANATVLTGTTASDSADNTTATEEVGDFNKKNVWWKWTAPATGEATFDAVNSAPNYISMGIYLGSSGSTLGPTILETSASYSTPPKRKFPVAAGTTYMIGLGTSSASFVGLLRIGIILDTSTSIGQLPGITQATMTNDTFANRLTLNGTTASAIRYNLTAGNEAGEPTTSGKGTFWFQYKPAVNGRLTLTSEGSTASYANLAAYLGNSLASLRVIKYAEDFDLTTITFPVTAGVDYQISIGVDDNTAYGQSGTLVLGLSLDTQADISSLVTPVPATMSNDNFSARINLVGDAVGAIAYNATATNETGEPTTVGRNNFWWTYRPSATGRLSISSQGSDISYASITLYQGTSLSSLKLVGGKANFSGVAFSLPVTGGTDYQICFGTSSTGYGTVGAFVMSVNLDKNADVSLLNITTPASALNDNFVNRVTLSGDTLSAIGYNPAASREPLEPNTTQQNTLWWSWTPTASGTAQLDFTGSDANVLNYGIVSVWQGAGLASLTSITVSSKLTFPSVSGQTYHIAVGASNTSRGGSIVMTISGPPSKPSWSNPQNSLLLALGSTVQFNYPASGGGVTYQWLKSGSAISGATGFYYSRTMSALTDAGIYSLKATNRVGSSTSNGSNIGLVDISAKTALANEGGILKLTVGAAGPGLSYRWRQGTTDLSDLNSGGRIISGSGSSALSISAVSATDATTYSCLVTMANPLAPGSPFTLRSGIFTVSVLQRPVMSATAPPPAALSKPLSWQLSASNSPTKFVVTGLPSGLTHNATTGLITGTPNVSGSIAIKAYASNAAGNGAVQNYNLVVAGLPTGTTGTWSGSIARHRALNANLGGIVVVKVTSTGTYTGIVGNGVAPIAMSGRLVGAVTGNPTLSQRIVRPGLLDLWLNLTLDATNSVLTGAITDGTDNSTISGGKQTFGPTNLASSYAGLYNTTVDIRSLYSADSYPQGRGYAQLTVSAQGAVTGSGRNGDGTAYTVSTSLWADARFPLYVLLYAGRGSIAGVPTVSLGVTGDTSDDRITATYSWYKMPSVVLTDRNYPAGFDIPDAVLVGSRWTATTRSQLPTGWTIRGNNARIAITLGGTNTAAQVASLAQTYTLGTNGVGTFVSALNICGITSSVNLATGVCTGNFRLVDTGAPLAITRTASYYALMIPHTGNVAYGWFSLPQLPAGGQTLATSPILAGRVEMTPQ